MIRNDSSVRDMISKNKERANTKREERKGEQDYKRDLATQEAREDWKRKPTEQRKQLLEDIKTKIEQANQNEDKRERAFGVGEETRESRTTKETDIA